MNNPIPDARGASKPGGDASLLSKLFAYAPTTLIRIIIRFAALYLFTRLLSPAEYGVYTLVLSGVALAQTLLFLWIEAAVFRFVLRARQNGWLADLTATLARLSALVMTVSALVAAGAAFFLLILDALSVVPAILLGLSLAILGFLTNLRREVLRAEARTTRYALLDAATKIGGLGLGVVLIVFGDWRGLGPIAGACLALCLILMGDILTWKSQPAVGRYRGRVARLAFRYGFGLALAQGAAILLATGDRFVIAAMLGTDAAGAYAAGYGLAAQLVGFIFAGTSLAATPLTLRALESSGPKESLKVARTYINLLLFLTVPAAVGLILVAAPLAHLVIGDGLASASVSVIQWIAPASVLAGLVANYAELPFVLKRRTSQFGVLLGLAGGLNILLNIALIPFAGIVGAIIATNVCYAIALMAALVVGHRLFPLPFPARMIALVCLNTCAMVLAVLALRAPIKGLGVPAAVELIVLAGTGALVYLVSSLATNRINSRLNGKIAKSSRPESNG